MTDWYRVTFWHPNGFRYEVTGQAETETEAVRLADGTLEYMERLGVSDYLSDDGLSVRAPARLMVEVIDAAEAGPGFGLVVTHPDGRLCASSPSGSLTRQRAATAHPCGLNMMPLGAFSDP